MGIHEDRSGGRGAAGRGARRGGDGPTAQPLAAARAVAEALGGLSPATALALQRSVGNAVVSRLVESERHTHDGSCGHGPDVQRSGVHEVLNSSGTPLDAPVRAEMEARLGADFSDVRVHTGAAAQRSAAEIGARAYTSGSSVVIGAGGGDKHTLAHELTHVVQQRTGPVAGTDNGSGLRVSDPSDRFEREAESNARRVMSGPVPAPQVSRAPAHSPQAGQPGQPEVQRAGDRSANPHADGGGVHDGWELTAHHIVPHTALKTALAKLSPEQQQAVLIRAVPATISDDMLRRLGLSDKALRSKVNLVGLRRDLTNPNNTTGEATPGITYDEMRLAFYEWQGGNQFLGPNTSIRAEPSSDKDGIDVDGIHFLAPEAEKLKQEFSRLVKLGNELKQLLRSNSEPGAIAAVLTDILKLTRDAVPSAFDPSGWVEIVDPARVEKLAESNALNRAHLADYSFFRFGTAALAQQCPMIVQEGSDRYEQPGTDKGGVWTPFTGQSRTKLDPGLFTVKGNATFINMARLDAKHPDLYAYCKARKIPASTYLPKGLCAKLGISAG